MRGLVVWGSLLGLLVQAGLASGQGAIRPRDTAAVVTLYRMRDGLPQSEVTCIHRDGQSVMWFGTRGGLARYDGEQFVTFHHHPADTASLGSDDVRQIRSDPRGNLWIATSAGVSRYSPVSLSFRNYKVQPGSGGQEPASGVWAVDVDCEGRVWVLTTQALGLLDTVSGRVRQFPYPPHRAYSAAYGRHLLEHDGQGCFWLVRGGELLLFRPSEMAYVPDDEQSVLLSGVHTWGITGLALQQDGSVWLGRGASMYHYERPGTMPLLYRLPLMAPAESAEVGALVLDAHDRPWCRVGSAFLRLDPADGHWLRVSSLWENGLRIGPTHYEAYDFTDTRNYWLSADGGVARWYQASGFITEYSYRIYGEPLFPNLDVRSVWTHDDRVLWVGTCGGGVSRFDRVTGRVEQLPRQAAASPLRLDTVYALVRGASGAVIAIAPGGAALYDSVARVWRDLDVQRALGQGAARGDFRCGAFADSLHLLLGGPRGLCVVNLRTRQAQRVAQLDGVPITSMLHTPKGVYLAGSSALLVYDARTQTLTRHEPQAIDPTLPQPETLEVRALAYVPSGPLYVGTNQGIYRYEANAFMRVGQRMAPIPQNEQFTQSLLVDGHGVVWSASPQWIGEYAWDDEDFYTYGVADVVDVGEYNGNAAWRSPGGCLYFGGKNGLVVLDAERDRKSGQQPPVILSQCIVENATERLAMPLRGHDTIDVPRGYNAITLSFALLDYSAPGSAHYQYMVEGLAEDWRDVLGGHTVTVANLPAGTARVRYRASNRAGIWWEGREYMLVVHRTRREVLLLTVGGLAIAALLAGFGWSLWQHRSHPRTSR